jgi:alpha-ketoglutarate-dependent 2,4-dichlorophenoxyacetate dioxygenase
MITPKPLHPLFAAELAGIDLTQPIDEATLGQFRRAMDQYAVGVLRHSRPLRDAEHVAFSSRLGPLQQMKMLTMVGKSRSRFAYPELIDVGNIDAEGNLLPDDDRRRAYNRGNLLWHTDVSFDPIRATYSLLAAHVVPPGRAPTEFADMRAAYDALPADMKARIEDLVVEHSVWYSRALGGLDATDEERATRPPSHHKLVHVHPGSGRKALYLASHASHVIGWPRDAGRLLLDDLTEFATQPRFVYRHEWEVGDLVIWDNLATMHRGTPFDDNQHVRDMRRVTVLERAA